MTVPEKELLLAVFASFLKKAEIVVYLQAILTTVFPDWRQELTNLQQVAQEMNIEKTFDFEVSEFRRAVEQNNLQRALLWFNTLKDATKDA